MNSSSGLSTGISVIGVTLSWLCGTCLVGIEAVGEIPAGATGALTIRLENQSADLPLEGIVGSAYGSQGIEPHPPIEPETLASLAPGESAEFIVRFNVDEDAVVGSDAFLSVTFMAANGFIDMDKREMSFRIVDVGEEPDEPDGGAEEEAAPETLVPAATLYLTSVESPHDDFQNKLGWVSDVSYRPGPHPRSPNTEPAVVGRLSVSVRAPRELRLGEPMVFSVSKQLALGGSKGTAGLNSHCHGQLSVRGTEVEVSGRSAEFASDRGRARFWKPECVRIGSGTSEAHMAWIRPGDSVELTTTTELRPDKPTSRDGKDRAFGYRARHSHEPSGELKSSEPPGVLALQQQLDLSSGDGPTASPVIQLGWRQSLTVTFSDSGFNGNLSFVRLHYTADADKAISLPEHVHPPLPDWPRMELPAETDRVTDREGGPDEGDRGGLRDEQERAAPSGVRSPKSENDPGIAANPQVGRPDPTQDRSNGGDVSAPDPRQASGDSIHPQGQDSLEPRVDPAGEAPSLPPSPSTDPRIAPLITEWLGSAEPPPNATDGSGYHYSPWGVMVGRGTGMVATANGPPDAARGMTETDYLWGQREGLDSVDHCTLGEFIELRLSSQSTETCRGRYQPRLPDLVGQGEAVAIDRLQGLRLTPRIRDGEPAPSTELAGRVSHQSTAAGTTLTRGTAVDVWIYGSYDPRVAMDDWYGRPVAEARDALERQGFEVAIRAGAPAPDAVRSGAVEQQMPVAGDLVEPGGRVTLIAYTGFVDLVTLTEVRGLPAVRARELLQQQGFEVELGAGSAAQSAAVAGTVESQTPSAGMRLERGATVQLAAHTAFVDLVVVPSVVGRSLADARAVLERQGARFALGANPNGTRVVSQSPSAGMQIPRGAAVTVALDVSQPPTTHSQPPPATSTLDRPSPPVPPAPPQPNLSCAWSSQFGEIRWSEGWYGNERQRIRGGLQLEGRQWVFVGDWYYTNQDRKGTLRFVFDTLNSFQGRYARYGTDNASRWEGEGNCGPPIQAPTTARSGSDWGTGELVSGSASAGTHGAGSGETGARDGWGSGSLADASDPCRRPRPEQESAFRSVELALERGDADALRQALARVDRSCPGDIARLRDLRERGLAGVRDRVARSSQQMAGATAEARRRADRMDSFLRQASETILSAADDMIARQRESGVGWSDGSTSGSASRGGATGQSGGTSGGGDGWVSDARSSGSGSAGGAARTCTVYVDPSLRTNAAAHESRPGAAWVVAVTNNGGFFGGERREGTVATVLPAAIGAPPGTQVLGRYARLAEAEAAARGACK